MASNVKKFEDLEVWKEGMRMASMVYRLFRDCRDYGLKDQLQRAAVSIPSNIAEGFERNSNKEFIQHLFITEGSCAELRTQLYLCIDLKILDQSTNKKLLEQTRKVSAMLFKLIRTRREKFS